MNSNTSELNSSGSPSVTVNDIIGTKAGKTSILVMILCFCIMLMDGYDYGIISNASPLIMKEWHISSALFGPVFSVATFGWIFGAMIFGAISDKIGRKKSLIIGSILFTVMTLFTYLSRTLTQLLAIRLITGFGMGAAVPVAMTLTSEYAPIKSKAKFVTIMFSGFVVGATLGSYLAAALMPAYGWRSIFLVGFLIPIPMIAVLWAALPESIQWLVINGKTEKQKKLLVAIANRMAPDLHVDENTVIIADTGAKKNEKYSPKELFEGKLKWCSPLLWLYYLVSSLALFFIQSWLPQLLVMKGLTASHASSIIGTSGLFGIAGTILVGLWLDKLGFKWGFVWPLLTMIFISLIGGSAGTMMIVWICINSFFMNGEHTILTALVPSIYPAKIKAQGTGISNAIAKLGSIIGPVVGGVLISTGMPMTKLFYLAALPFIFCIIFCLILGSQYDNYFSKIYAGEKQEKQKVEN